MEYALVLLWLVAFHALALVGLPVAARLFPRFPDRGATLSLPVALVVATTVVYWVGHVGFGRWTAFVGVGALAGLSAVLVWHDSNASIRPREYADAAAVFTVAFLFLVAVRAIDPAIVPGGGEKFLDFGIYKSLLRGDALPPEDMWWAGDHVLYYYGGHLMAAILTHLTDTAPRYGYNLALSGFYASLVTAAYGLAAAMADARGAPRRAGGVLGGFLVGFASNLVVPVTGLVWLLPGSLATGVADRIAATMAEPYSGELVREGLSEFGYWAPSRVIPDTINEFPLFAFYNGDLHGHMLSTQFLLLIAALGYAYYRTPSENRGRRRTLFLGVLPPVVALLTMVNVWSFATGLGVVWLALVFAPADPLSLIPGVSAVVESRDATAAVSNGGEASPGDALLAEARRIAGAFAATAVVGVLTVVWASPFVAGILLQSASNRSLGLLPTPASATGLLVVFGAFLSVFALYLWPRARESFSVDPARFGLLAGALVALAWLADYAVLALVAPLILVGWLLLRTESDTGYETVLVVAGAGLVTLVEFAYVQDNAATERFNTVFKVYMQVWVLWGPAAGAALATLMSREANPGNWSFPGVGRVSRADAMTGFAVLLVASTSMYGAFAMSDHFAPEGEVVGPDDATLDGLAYLESSHPHEVEAIHWLDDREGQPHVATAPGYDVYTWSSPASSLTGVPTVVGWVWQEGVYRGHDAAEFRASEVDLIYEGQWSDRAELLKQYDVEYVYVGPLEREQYDSSDLDFAEYPGIEEAFRNDGVVVYRVNQSEL
ncbi:DUF2298 domain-containing protein [Halorussus amylolyticus]|uniref:DUF2298 domain-containing protein n=1 Tax=Halorussus amylolyticus TaxID=1126242 RepID=UPI0010438F0C|nr:DUF2298 domain-containing protein [Halorussus amylolyticus]